MQPDSIRPATRAPNVTFNDDMAIPIDKLSAASRPTAPKSTIPLTFIIVETGHTSSFCGLLPRCGTLAVGIRTFEWRQGRLHLGTGAGITWGSDPRREWDETELKVRTLLAVR